MSQSKKQLSQADFMKKSILILVSVSIFSFLFSQPSKLISGLLNFFYHYGSTLSFKFFDYNTERNYVFLLFNGLLALMIKNSGLINNSQGNSNLSGLKIATTQRFVADGSDLSKQKTDAIQKDGRKNGIMVVAKNVEEEDKNKGIQENYQIPAAEEEEEHEEDKNHDTPENYQISATDQGEEVELLSAEELNRKCDDFIRKMREEIRMDSQQSRS